LLSVALASFEAGDASFLTLTAPVGVDPPNPATIVMSAATLSLESTPAIATVTVQATSGAFQLSSLTVVQDSTIGATAAPATGTPGGGDGDAVEGGGGGMGVGAIIGIVVVVLVLAGTAVTTVRFKQRNGRYPTSADAVGFWKYTVLNEPRPASGGGNKSRRASTREQPVDGAPSKPSPGAGPPGPGGYPNQFGAQGGAGGQWGQQGGYGQQQQQQWGGGGGGSPYPSHGGSFAGGQYPQAGMQQQQPSQFSAGNAFAPPGGQAGPGSYQGVFSNSSAPGAPAGTPGIACGYPGCSNTYLTQQDLQIHKQKRGHYT
jgi:hypothetical protein